MKKKSHLKQWIGYNKLDMVISIGYRVNSDRAVQFRRQATYILKEFSKELYERGAFDNKNYEDIMGISKSNNSKDNHLIQKETGDYDKDI